MDQNLNLVFDDTGKQTNALPGTATSKFGHRIVRLGKVLLLIVDVDGHPQGYASRRWPFALSWEFG